MSPLRWLTCVSLILVGTGCAALPRERVTDYFNSMSVPHIWRNTQVDAGTVVESTVAANAAGQVADPESTPTAPLEEIPPAATPAEIVTDRSSTKTDDAPAPTEPKVEAPGVVTSTMQRLREALSTDVREAVAPLDPFSRQHPLRLRIESLLGRAQTALDDGDLEAARIAAERAVQLSDSSAIEYLPDEERPEEVLQRIVERIDARDLAPSEVSPESLLPPLVTPMPGPPQEEVAQPVQDITQPVQESADPLPVVVANRPLSVELPASIPAETVVADSSSEAGSFSAEPTLPAIPTTNRTSVPSAPAEPTLPLLPNDPAPAPPQIDEAEPFPQVKRLEETAAAAPAQEEPIALFIWADLWPLAILGGLIALCAAALGIRAMLARRRG